MLKTASKKALVILGLFFCGLAWAQSPRLLQPLPGQALENPQPVRVSVPEGDVTRVELHLNGKLQQARRRAPFHFQLAWDTSLNNRLKVVVRFKDRKTFVLEREFQQIRTDEEAAVANTAMFPFLEQPLDSAPFEARAANSDLKPIRLEAASAFPLDLTVVLDVSGSMLTELDLLDGPVKALLAHLDGKTNRLRLIAFDNAPRALEAQKLPAKLSQLHRGVGQSIVWDAIATAASQFDRVARKTIILISDGADNGSSHSAATVADYLRQSGTALIWISPTGRRDKTLRTLAEQSGGFTYMRNETSVWTTLTNRFNHQVYLLLPGQHDDLKLRTDAGGVWYPRWQE